LLPPPLALAAPYNFIDPKDFVKQKMNNMFEHTYHFLLSELWSCGQIELLDKSAAI